MTTTDAGDLAVVQRRAVLSLGSNLGDRLDNLQEAIDALFDAPGLRLAAISAIYETGPVGGPEQPDYLNAVAVADTKLAPLTLLERVQSIEEALRRERQVRFGPRTIDIDIILLGELASDAPELILPHPRAHERAFVLVPWSDVDPAAELPGRGRVTDLLAAVKDQSIRRRDDLSLQQPA